MENLETKKNETIMDADNLKDDIKNSQNKYILSFSELVRQNTGMHFLDSGGTSGRYWQRELPKNELIIETDSDSINVYISIHHFLEKNLIIDKELTQWIQDIDNAENGLNIFDLKCEKFEKKFNKKFRIIENTYNQENDFSQDFQFAIFSDKDDYIYDDDAIIVIQSHNGADIRGGYSTFIVANSKEEFCNFFRWNVGFYLENHSEIYEYATGYSSNPLYRLNQDIEKVYGYKSGYILAKIRINDKIIREKIYVDYPY